MSAPPRVFISATSADLRSVRKLVTDAVLTMGCHPVAQDHFPPGYRTVATTLEDTIKSCQALIHIVGHHYGAEPDPGKVPAGVRRRSYSQMEYDTARKLGIKTYVFVCPEEFSYDETAEPEPEELRQLQESHRQAILTGDRLYTPVADRGAVASSVQQLQLELNELRGKVERGKRGIIIGIAALILVLSLIGAGISRVVRQSGRQTTALSEIQDKLDSDRKLMLAVLTKVKEAQIENANLTAAQRFELAVQSVATEKSLSPAEVQASMDLFAASVEAEKDESSFDQALVAMGARDFDKAADRARDAVAEAEEAEKSGEQEGRLAEAYSLLGDALLAARRFDEAAEAYRKAAALVDPEKAPELWAKLVSWTGSALEGAGKPEDAEAFRRSMTAGAGAAWPGGAGKVVMSSTGDYGIKGPPSSPAGATIALEIVGTVPPDADLLAIVARDEPTTSTAFRHSASVRGKAGPIELSGPTDPGSFDVRLLSTSSGGEGRRILSLFPIELTPAGISVVAPDSVGAGASFEVVWTGPDGKGDMITIVVKGTEAGKYHSYAYTKTENPARLRAPDTPGECEVRYLSGQDRKTMATADVNVTPQSSTLKAVPEAVGGAMVTVEWTGPANKGDLITAVKIGAKEGTYTEYAYTENAGKKPLEVHVPEEPGEYELRYVTGYEKKTLASTPIRLTPIVATISAPIEAVAGSEVEVTWTGPAHRGDMILIVSKDAEDKEYKNYKYAKDAEPTVKVLSIETPGEAEVRYLTQGRRVAARQTIQLLEATARLLDAPAEVAADDRVQLKWEGPDNRSDTIVFALPDDKPNAYKSLIYCRNGHENNEIRAPKEPGIYELRYVTGQDKKILARSTIVVK